MKRWWVQMSEGCGIAWVFRAGSPFPSSLPLSGFSDSAAATGWRSTVPDLQKFAEEAPPAPSIVPPRVSWSGGFLGNVFPTPQSFGQTIPPKSTCSFVTSGWRGAWCFPTLGTFCWEFAGAPRTHIFPATPSLSVPESQASKSVSTPRTSYPSSLLHSTRSLLESSHWWCWWWMKRWFGSGCLLADACRTSFRRPWSLAGWFQFQSDVPLSEYYPGKTRWTLLLGIWEPSRLRFRSCGFVPAPTAWWSVWVLPLNSKVASQDGPKSPLGE